MATDLKHALGRRLYELLYDYHGTLAAKPWADLAQESRERYDTIARQLTHRPRPEAWTALREEELNGNRAAMSEGNPRFRMDALKFRAGLDAWGVRLEDAQALERELHALQVLTEEMAVLLGMATFQAQPFAERQAAALRQWEDRQGFEGDVCAWQPDWDTEDFVTTCGQEFGWEGGMDAVHFCHHCGRRVTFTRPAPEPEDDGE